MTTPQVILDYMKMHSRKFGHEQSTKDLQTGLYLLNRKNGNKIKIEIDGDYGTQTHSFLENARKTYPAQAIQKMIKRAAVSSAIFDTKNNKKIDTERQVERALNNFGESTVLKGGISNVRYVWSCEGTDPCNECAALDGQEFDCLDDVPDRPHPNCQCTVYPIGNDNSDDEPCDCQSELEDWLSQCEDACDEVDCFIEEGESVSDELDEITDYIENYSSDNIPEDKLGEFYELITNAL